MKFDGWLWCPFVSLLGRAFHKLGPIHVAGMTAEIKNVDNSKIGHVLDVLCWILSVAPLVRNLLRSSDIRRVVLAV